MSLRDEYGRKVDGMESRIEERFSKRHLAHMQYVLDEFMPFALLLILFVVSFQFFIALSPAAQQMINWLNWILIGYFGVRLVIAYRLSSSHVDFLHNHWLDLFLVIPVFSMMQEFRALRLLPAMEEAPVMGQFMASTTVTNTSYAAKMTRIVRIVKRSFGM